jgi:hypothetical protein
MSEPQAQVQGVLEFATRAPVLLDRIVPERRPLARVETVILTRHPPALLPGYARAASLETSGPATLEVACLREPVFCCGGVRVKLRWSRCTRISIRFESVAQRSMVFNA